MCAVAEIEEAIVRLPTEEFAQLLEDLRDIEVAHAAIAEASEAGELPRQWIPLRSELDAAHR
jgi:hypothetical protein